MKRLLLILIAVAILSGCASINHQVMGISPSGESFKRIFRKDPGMLVGVVETDAIKNGQATIIPATLSKKLIGGEGFLFRIGWDAVVIDPKSGKEVVGQVIFAGKKVREMPGGARVFYPLGLVVIDSKWEAIKNWKGFIRSTDGSYAYNFAGQEIRIESEKLKEASYRKKIAAEHGSQIGDYVRYDEYIEVINGWNRFSTPDKGVFLLSPLSEEMIGDIAKINPQYNFFQRFVAKGSVRIGDPVLTLMSLAQSVLVASSSSPAGPDFGSVIGRRDMGVYFDFLERLDEDAAGNYFENRISLSKGGKR